MKNLKMNTIHRVVSVILTGLVIFSLYGMTYRASASERLGEADLITHSGGPNHSSSVLAPAQSDLLNPPFPRLYYGTPNFSSQTAYSDGALGKILGKYDFLAHTGMGEWNVRVSWEAEAENPSIIRLGTSKQGVWPGEDPAQCFVLRSESAYLLSDVQAGTRQLHIDSLDAIRKIQISQPDRYSFAIINNMDIFEYQGFEAVDGGYLLTGIPASGDLALESHVRGEKVKSIIRFPGFGMLHDLTSYAPRLSDGRECWRYFIDNRFEETDFTAYDGIHYDAFRDFFWSEDFENDIDLDRNDVNDIQEHGMDWVNAIWKEGVIKTIEYEKDKFAQINPGKPVLYTINTGNGGDTYLKDYVNGVLFEGFMRFAWNWNHMVESQQAWMQAVEGRGEPFLYAIEDYVKEEDALDGKNDYRYMRYGLTTTLMGDGYYGRTFGDFFYIALWYDEFETDLGYPRSEAIRLDNHCHQESGQEEFCVHVRFFDKGVVIVNPTTAEQIVTDQELRVLANFYAGPYYRFRGGQDPDFNNGQLFTSVTLHGEAGSREKHNRGDGIILLTQPETIISDIIVGNHENNDTSPGSRAAEYVGDWQRKLAKGGIEPPNPYYSQWNVNYDVWGVYEGSGYSVAPAGEGESYAIYRPGIGVSGYYEVFEWHGWHGDTQASYQEGTAVPHEIHQAGGVQILKVNQQQDPGQWNSLGTFYFEKGNQGYVKISNDDEGYVIADAIRFVWRDGSTNPTFVDVPLDHPYYAYIQRLYDHGFIAGCNTNPMQYCPEQDMKRSESAVFIERGVHGAEFDPQDPTTIVFDDVALEAWYADWVHALWEDHFTAGCGTDPLMYCPEFVHSRAEAAVFFMRMMYGADYQPPQAQGIFADVDYENAWYGPWVDAAWQAGISEPCATEPELRYCPDEPLTRAVGAYMMVKAKDLD